MLFLLGVGLLMWVVPRAGLSAYKEAAGRSCLSQSFEPQAKTTLPLVEKQNEQKVKKI